MAAESGDVPQRETTASGAAGDGAKGKLALRTVSETVARGAPPDARPGGGVLFASPAQDLQGVALAMRERIQGAEHRPPLGPLEDLPDQYRTSRRSPRDRGGTGVDCTDRRFGIDFRGTTSTGYGVRRTRRAESRVRLFPSFRRAGSARVW